MPDDDDLAAQYWDEVAERSMLMHGTREQQIEYQARVFPIEELLATRLDDGDPSLVDDLVLIAEAAPSPEALAMFGAGSVSEILYNGGESIIDELVEAGSKSPAFLEALRGGFFGWEGLPRSAKKRLAPLVEQEKEPAGHDGPVPGDT